MSEHNLTSFLDRQLPALIQEIKKELPLSDLASGSQFERFVKSLYEEHIANVVNNKDWQNNTAFLALLDEITNEINNQFINEDKNMIEGKALAVGTKVATIPLGTLALGTVALVGVAAGVYYLCKQRENEQSNARTGTTTSVKDHESVGAKKDNPLVKSPPYTPHNLLLVMPANRLPENFATGQISNDKINDLIVNAVRAYSFAVGDEKGKQIMNAVDCSDTPIDVTTENRVFVQLQLLAQSEITTQRNKLNIREKVSPSSNGEVLQIKNLESARSASESTGFYKI
jgi:hypothetical protein